MRPPSARFAPKPTTTVYEDVSRTPGRVELYGADATTGQTSGAVYLSRQATRGVGRWLSLSTPRLTLGRDQGQTVSFSVHVPSGVHGGQYLAGLVAQPVQARSPRVTHKGKRTFRVNIQEITIVAVEVVVSGPAQQRMSVTGVSASGRPGYQTVMIGLANTGDRLVKGHGHLTVAAAGGRRALSRSFSLDTFVPHTHIAFPVYVTGQRLPPGQNAASVPITYDNHHTQDRSFRFAITGDQVRQTYGTTAPSNLSSSGSSLGGVQCPGVGADPGRGGANRREHRRVLLVLPAPGQSRRAARRRRKLTEQAHAKRQLEARHARPGSCAAVSRGASLQMN